MKLQIDTHTHSTASGHAYSTIDDLARGARRRRLKGFVLTDHGPAMPGGPHAYHFSNLRIVPKTINGVFFFRGAELNISAGGELDLAPAYLRKMDFVMAGFHEVCCKPQDRDGNTRMLLAALANPFVDGISHPGNPAFPIDMEEAVKGAIQYGKALEINNSSFTVRPGSEDNCLALARLCKKHGALLCCGSDAHYWEDVGNFTRAAALLDEADIPRELVINSSLEQFLAFSEPRRARRIEEEKRLRQNGGQNPAAS